MLNRFLRILLLCTLAVAGPAVASKDHMEARELVRSGVILPLQQILEQSQAEYLGRVLEVELEKKHGRYVYEIELLDSEGRVWELYYDATSGELLKREQGD